MTPRKGDTLISNLFTSNSGSFPLACADIRPARDGMYRDILRKHNKIPDGPLLWQGLVVALILVLQMSSVASVGAATLALMTIWACRNTRCALQAVTISVLISFVNPALVGEQQLVPLFKWVLLSVALIRILADWRYWTGLRGRWIAYFVAFAIVALSLTLAVSADRSLSLLKLGSFTCGVGIALLGVHDRRNSPSYWLNWFITVYIVVLVLSAPLAFVAAGRHRNGWGFQGILSHPQTYGVYLAPITAYLTTMLLLNTHRAWFLVAVVLWGWYSIFASGCRTAFLAVGLAAVATIISVTLYRRQAGGSGLRRSTLLLISVSGFIGLALLTVNGSGVAEAFDKFVRKGSSDGQLTSSRHVQIEKQLSSIHDNLYAGVGFGLSPDTVEQITERDEITGVAISAPSEQGFLHLAVLTQVGVIGAVPLVLFVGTLALSVARHGSPPIVAMFWTALCINFGEMIFFSIGGLGMQMWLLLACCLVAGLTRRLHVRV